MILQFRPVMLEKKTKGGRKKMVFTPKAPPTDNFVIPSEPLPQKKVIHQKLKQRKAPNSTVAFTAFANTKESKEMIVMKDEKGELINFENEFDPQYIDAEENENLFDDDIMYIFSGIERGRCKIMVDNDKVYYEENGILSEMVSKNIDHMKVVVMNDDVKEIGSVYNAYTVCRNEL